MAESKKNLITYGVIILVILIVDIIGGYFIGKKLLNYAYNTEGLQESIEGESSEDKESNGESGQLGTMINLEAINLNPANSMGEIFSCEIVLEIKDEMVAIEVNNRNAQVMDKLSSYLSMKTVEELGDAKQWEIYRKEMVDIINSVLTDGEISSLYIKQKIIQFE